MKQKGKWSRTLILCGMMLLILCGLVTRMVQLQILRGPELALEASKSSTRVYTELASRGEIFDRNGVPIVTNALGYSVMLDYYQWNKETQNEIILSICGLLRDADIIYSDNLPLSVTPPFTYTYESEKSGEGKKLSKFIAAHEDWDVKMSAADLFRKLCELYGVDEHLTVAQRRTVVGVRYYMESCQFSSYNSPLTLAENVDIDTVSRIAEDERSLPGIAIQVSGTREYKTPYASHILGHVGAISAEEYEEKKDEGYKITDTVGRDGMEQVLEPYLRGINGVRAVEVSTETGKVINEYSIEPTDPGDNCRLTIDLALQKVAEDSLAETLDNIRKKGMASSDGSGADAEGGAAVVIDVNTGEILAMANCPTYNLASYSADFKANNENKMSPLFNRCIAAAYSPGSTFKLCSAMTALEEGAITPNTKITDKGIFTLYDSYQPRCWLYRQYGRTHGTINVSDAIKYSCNYFFYQVASQLGSAPLTKYASALGLGQKTGIELKGEKAGMLACPESRVAAGGGDWYPADTLMSYIGQGDHQYTPVQLANYVATIVNGGTRYRPHLLKSVLNYTNTKTIKEQEPFIIEKVEFSDSTQAAIKKGMKGVVTDDGTASSYFRSFPIAVGGKTGSAQNINHSATGIFVSFAPYENPEIAVVVIGEYAGSGGSMAPVCIAIYNQYFGLNKEEPAETGETEPGTNQTDTEQNGTEQTDTHTLPEDPNAPREEDPDAPQTDSSSSSSSTGD